MYIWSCVRDLGAVLLEAEAYSYAGVQVDIVRAEISGYFDAKSAAQFLGFVATLPYDGSDPDKARLWVAENISKPRAETIIGPVWFELRGDGSFVELSMAKPSKKAGWEIHPAFLITKLFQRTASSIPIY